VLLLKISNYLLIVITQLKVVLDCTIIYINKYIYVYSIDFCTQRHRRNYSNNNNNNNNLKLKLLTSDLSNRWVWWPSSRPDRLTPVENIPDNYWIKALWTQQLVWTLWRREISLITAANRTILCLFYRPQFIHYNDWAIPTLSQTICIEYIFKLERPFLLCPCCSHVDVLPSRVRFWID